jgi:hypothetical protein
MVYAVMYREIPAHDWVFQYWVTEGDPDKIVRSCQGLLASEHSCGHDRCQVGYIECADDATSDQLYGIRPTLVRFDPGYAKATARPDPDAALFDAVVVDAEDAEMVEVEEIEEAKVDNDEDIF